MEAINLENDIKVMYVTAAAFPSGVLEAHQKLHRQVPQGDNRKYFGVSRPDRGEIVYRAAAEEIVEGEAERLKLDTLIIKKGNYISTVVQDFMTNLKGIEIAFNQLLEYPNIDPQGYCVEVYLNDKDVQCMIRLKD
jgi:hypothetical protein